MKNRYENNYLYIWYNELINKSGVFLLNKKELRKKVLEARDKISDEELNCRSKVILEKVKEIDEFKKSKTIMIYVSYGKEINTHDFISECISMGKNVITPICRYSDRTLILGKTKSFPEGFNMTKYGILELEPNECEQIDPKDIDLIIMPGVAFTKQGDRMGYGGGYYDKLLSKASDKLVTIAPVLQEFIFDEIPIEAHDIPMDYVVADEDVFKII